MTGLLKPQLNIMGSKMSFFSWNEVTILFYSFSLIKWYSQVLFQAKTVFINCKNELKLINNNDKLFLFSWNLLIST